MNESDEQLIQAATEARARSVAPFSSFRVGAALQIWKALSEGERDFTDLVIVADTETLTPPCGTCRQIIWEFAKHATIVLANLRGQREEVHILDLLPRAFDARFLKDASGKTNR